MRRIAILAGALTLAACGDGGKGDLADRNTSAEAAANGADTQEEAGKADAGAAASGASDEAAPGDDAMIWNFNRSSEGPKLAYGEPRTDNLKLMLRCPPGESSVLVSFIRPSEVVARRPGRLTLASDGAELSVPIEAEESELGGHFIEVTAPLDAAPWQRFREGQGLEVRWGEETISVPAGDAVGRFFDACPRP